jgi:hypothetical protein
MELPRCKRLEAAPIRTAVTTATICVAATEADARLTRSGPAAVGLIATRRTHNSTRGARGIRGHQADIASLRVVQGRI